MDVIGIASALGVGLVLGWVGHWLTVRRSKEERAVSDATELWDRCGEIAAARVKYVLAYHRRLPNKQSAKDEHLDLKRRSRWADPEVVLLGTAEWEAYHAAERAALKDESVPITERIKRVETTSFVLFDAIGERRVKARKLE